MVKDHRPRRGSIGVYPRVRAKSIVARIRRWPKISETIPLAFAGYKAGMTHVIYRENNPNHPFFGKEVAKAVTIVECPPLLICGIRVYEKTPYGYKCLGEVWSKELPEDLKRKFTVPKAAIFYRIKIRKEKGREKIEKEIKADEKIKEEAQKRFEEQLKKIESVKDKIASVRLIVAAQPRLTTIGKKKPEVFEINIGGDPIKALEYAIKKIGKELRVTDVFKEGQFVDVIAVTKGKGTQGVIKRFGVKILPRWHKHRKGHRRTGSIGPQKPGVMFRIPRAGQMGFHQRTEYNKRILKIVLKENLNDFNVVPKGGLKHYGVLKNDFILIEGTVPGPVKRLIKIRYPVRPIGLPPVQEAPEIVYIHV
ncbi:MAG: 50S ribosomal protein L3 [Thermoprotei archaeon]|nr:MAG: 50S ribosomal protein L3 [Thermoprotei archaeon]RLF01080.1 MAG: 50S ribosomal protein L3 [Thermoprotei archaeon]HDI74852.1 50S ribosomal protein L3 [Thermoprotei archaeon]